MPDLNELHSRREELRSELDRVNQELAQARRIAEEQGSSGFSSSGSSSPRLAQIARERRNAKRPWK